MTINLKIPEDISDVKLIETKFTDFIKKEMKTFNREMNYFYYSSLNDDFPSTDNEEETYKFHEKTIFFEINLFSKQIGFIIIVPGKTKKVVWITDFYIVKNFRNKGYGTEIIKKLKNLLKSKGFEKITLTVFNKNINAVKLYEKNGFNIPISKTIACEI